jgi:hypothetical protein
MPRTISPRIKREVDEILEKSKMHDREAQEAQFDWPFVANAVRKAVSRTFRVLGNPTTGYRVFIADAYRSLTPGERAAIDAHTLPQFKQLLIALNRRRLINLNRADIQEIWIADGRTARDRAASRKLAKESETTSLGAEFHFIGLWQPGITVSHPSHQRRGL